MHTQAEEIEIRRVLKRTLDVWPGRAPNVEVYYDALSDLPATAVLEGIRETVRGWHFSQRPVPGDFRRQAQAGVDGRGAEPVAGDDGYLRGPDGRHIVMDEMAVREVYRREFNYVPPGWTDEAMAEREALRTYYQRRDAEPASEWSRRLVENLRRAKTLPREPPEAA